MPTNMTRQGNNLPNGNFIPAIWSKKLNVKYYAQTCMMKIFNSNWEGEIKGAGSQVEIRVRPDIQVEDYVVGKDLALQDVTDSKITLYINKAKYFNFGLDDVDAAQADINIINELTLDASEQMKIAVEKDIFANIYSDAGLSLPSLTLDKTNILDWIIDAGVKLGKKNIPTRDRWLLIPHEAAGYLQKSDLKNTAVTGDDTSVMRNSYDDGRLGTLAGFTVYVSNNLYSSGTTFQCLAGHKSAVTYASQIVKVEHYRPENGFRGAVKGLNVYGYKTAFSDGLVVMPAVIA
jgi:hypothetical protein